MKSITTPNGISKEAQAFYSQTFHDVPMIDFTLVEQVNIIRDSIHPIWKQLSEQIQYEYNFDKVDINSIPCYQIDPPQLVDDELVILYVHGGSNFFGHPTLCKNIPVKIAHNTGLRVISIEYRLGPEHVFPAPIDDILNVIVGLKDHFGEQINFGLVGHSAGGGLALSAALQAKQKQLLCPKALALLAPWIEMELVGDSMTTLEAFDPNVPSHEWFYNSVEAFIGDYSRTDPLLSPLYGDLSGLCPTYIQMAGRDRVLSDGIRLNRRLLDENVASTLDVWDGMWHGFQMFPLLPEAEQANKMTSRFLRSALLKL